MEDMVGELLPIMDTLMATMESTETMATGATTATATMAGTTAMDMGVNTIMHRRLDSRKVRSPTGPMLVF